MASAPVSPTQASPSMTVPWTLGDAAKATALVLVIGGTMFLVFLGGQAVRLFDRPGEVAGLLFSAILEGVFLLAVWRFGPWKYSQSWRALGLQGTLNKGASLALLVFLASVGFVLFYSLTTTMLGLEKLTPPPLPSGLLETYPQRLAFFFVAVLVAPVAEEVFFRGFLLPVFTDQWGFLRGASLVSLLFGISHAVPGALLPAFVSGLLFAWLYRRTGSLWNCCMAHGAQNALAFAVAVSV